MDPDREDQAAHGPRAVRRSYRVEAAGVGGPRGQQGRLATVALVAVLALVGGAIISSQLFPAGRGAVAAQDTAAPSDIAQDTAAPSAETRAAPFASVVPRRTPFPIPSAPLTPRVTADRVDVSALVAAIPRHGTGPLAFVSGRLRSTQRPCARGAPVSACFALQLDGFRGAKIVPDDTMSVWPGDPVLGETLVLLPRDGKLVYLGSLVVDPAGIQRIDVLTATMETVPVGPGQPLPSLHEADGILVNGVTPCIGPATCPPGAPTLLAIPPSGGWEMDYTGAQPVRIVDGAFGIRPSAVWTTGPFLLRLRVDATRVAWEVVAREDQGSILHVTIP
jgi:hypothetical protein